MTSTSLKRRCETHKDCQDCKQVAKDILTLVVWNDKLRAEFKMLKGNNNTENKYMQTGYTCNWENTTKEAYKQKQTFTKEGNHAIILHKVK